MISNGNRTEWSPIRSVIIQVITKSDDRTAGVRFFDHEYDYRPNWMTRINHKNYNFREKQPSCEKRGKFALKYKSKTKKKSKNTKASARARTRNYNFECDWLF